MLKASSRFKVLLAALAVSVSALTGPATAATPIDIGPVGAPLNPIVYERAGTYLLVTWSAPVINPELVSGYEIRYSADAGQTWNIYASLAGNETSVKMLGLDRGNNYFIQVRALGSEGNSVWVSVNSSELKFNQISAGRAHTCAVAVDSSLYCWGSDSNGQIGDGVRSSRPVLYPSRVDSLPAIAEVSAGEYHTCARAVSGLVYCWGYNDQGQAGTDYSTVPRPRPVLLKSPAVRISVGMSSSCAILSDKTLWCWGNAAGNQSTPMKMNGLSAVKAVSVGTWFWCALQEDGAVYCAGNNSWGQLGVGTTADSATVSSAAGQQMTDLSAHYGFACGVTGSGGVQCWGYNSSSQLGDGTTDSQARLVAVTGLSGVKAVTTGGAHTCATMTNNMVKCWGYNGNGQLGDGSTTNRKKPTPVTGLGEVSQVVAGGWHTCALDVAGNIYCWGESDQGQLGNGGQTRRDRPSRLRIASGVTGLTVGYASTCIRSSNDDVRCWGFTTEGLFVGEAGNTSYTGPVVMTIPSTVALSVGRTHACAVITDGTVKCWGNNDAYQIGQPEANQNYAPTTVAGVAAVKHLEVAESATCALTKTGDVYCWGAGSALGSDTWANSSQPLPVAGLTGVQQIAGGGSSTFCAVKSDALVACWGNGYNGQLGSNSKQLALRPVQVQGLESAKSVAVGFTSSCAVLLDDTVKCWGSNEFGQIGDGTTTDRPTATQVLGLTNVFKVVIGINFACALTHNGMVKCWGRNASGALGDGTETNSNQPIDTLGLPLAIDIDATGEHACILAEDSSVWCWGSNSSNQKGTLVTTGDYDPLRVPYTAPARWALPGLPSSTSSISQSARTPSSVSVSWWDAAADGLAVDKYKVEWSKDAKTWSSKEFATATASLTGLDTAAEYSVRVTAHSDAGWGAVSEVSKVRTSNYPSAPTAPTQTTRTPGAIGLSWEVPSADDRTIDKYRVEWSPDGKNWKQAELNKTSVTISPLAVGSNYQVRVTAHSDAGWGSTSEIATMRTTKLPTVGGTVTQTNSASKSLDLAWPAGDGDSLAVDWYRLQWSTDGKNWLSKSVTSPSLTLAGLTPATVYQLRVQAHTNAGWGEFSPASTGVTTGTRTMRFTFNTSDGKPLTGGNVNWSLNDGSFESASGYGVTALGILDFPRVAAGRGVVRADSLVLPDGVTVSGSWSTDLGMSNHILKAPAKPGSAQYVIKVQLPNGEPVAGATVNVSGLSPYAYVNNFTFYAAATTSGITGPDGTFTATGFANGTPSAQVIYNDGQLTQRKNVAINSATTTATLTEMPWLDLVLDSATANLNALVPVDVSLQGAANGLHRRLARFNQPFEGATPNLSGIQVNIAAPVGADMSKCSGTVMTTKTDTSGKARLKVCAVKSGIFTVSGKGAAATGAFTLKVNGAPPMPVTSAAGVSPNLGVAKIAWNPPAFTGGAPILKYIVTLTGAGTTVVRTPTTTNISIWGLQNATTYSATIVAVTKNGNSDPVTVQVPVA